MNKPLIVDVTVTNLEGLDRIISQLHSLESIELAPLMQVWTNYMKEENDRGAMMGLDWMGHPLAPVTYRPKDTGKPVDMAILRNNNLTRSHYEILGGPPLAPRGLESRVISTYQTVTGLHDGHWMAQGSWVGFLSVDDEAILPFHAAGARHNAALAVRDVTHIRLSVIQRARDALKGFLTKILRRQGG